MSRGVLRLSMLSYPSVWMTFANATRLSLSMKENATTLRPCFWTDAAKPPNELSKLFFPFGKLSNLHSCKLEVHYDILAKVPCSKAVTKRWYYFLSFLLKAANAEDKPPLRNTPCTLFKENMTGHGVGIFMRIPYRTPYYVFSPITRRIPYGICVQKMPVLSVHLFRIFHGFSYQVWCCIFFVFCVSVCYVYVVLREKRSLPYVIFICFKTLLNVASKLQIFRARDRPFLSLWLVVCLVLNAAYQSHLVIDPTFHVSSDAIESVANFLQSEIKILIPADHLYGLKTYIWTTPGHAPLIEKTINVNEDIWDIQRPSAKIAYICSIEDFPTVLRDSRLSFFSLIRHIS